MIFKIAKLKSFLYILCLKRQCTTQNTKLSYKSKILNCVCVCVCVCYFSPHRDNRGGQIYLACCTKAAWDTTTNPGKANLIVNVLQPPLPSQITHLNPLGSELWCSYILRMIFYTASLLLEKKWVTSKSHTHKKWGMTLLHHNVFKKNTTKIIWRILIQVLELTSTWLRLWNRVTSPGVMAWRGLPGR